MNDILTLLGKNATIEVADVLSLLEGNPVSIPVDPFSQPVAGKTLTISLAANAVTLQIH